jgi:peptidoglycan/LPS O-acetylase OafA/YrhL
MIVDDPKLQTLLFIVLFVAAMLLTTRRVKRDMPFPPSVTNDLKGFAILTVMFGHVAYFLSRQPEFLYPLSIMAGVGVNVFLFLSGFGLTLSQEKGEQRPIDFYRHRMATVMVPLWATLVLLYTLDFAVLHRSYPVVSIVQSFFGWYPRALMFENVNAPLWYITFLLSYYVAFPHLYRRSRPYASVVLVILASLAFMAGSFLFVGDTVWLYIVHCNAFPLGMLAARLVIRLPKRPMQELVPRVFRISLALVMVWLVAYTAVHSGVGHWYEQPVSMVTTLALVALFVLLPFRSGFLALFGMYSYEIYLLHWPLASRYDVLFANAPPWLATWLYLGTCLAAGWALHEFVAKLLSKKTKTGGIESAKRTA